ncbi:MAG: prepilin-type N-terminal cleavage/methylation domain-containing protein [Methylacidiphilales bacterium]|nr:prepilin-type N-terminal cleavage/methylation domain-containing protein [Candidatus Methylacidiphilales bacterium]
MRLHPQQTRRVRAFTLLELLVVLAIMAILVGGSVLTMQGINNSEKFAKALNEISEILEQGRAYAVAQDTYVWVVLYENIPANNGPRDVYVGAFASNDGTDPFNWSGSVTMPSPGTVGSTTLSQIIRLYHYTGLHLQTTTLPDAPSNPNYPATAPVFQITAQSPLGPVALSNSSSVYWVIQFTPTGAAHNGANPIDSIWFGMQPSLSQTIFDTHNIASMTVSGLTGLTTTYRQ